MTNTPITNESEAMEVWQEAKAVHDGCVSGDWNAPDQAAARVIATALEVRDAELAEKARCLAEFQPTLDELRARAEQAEAALAERDAAIVEAVRRADASSGWHDMSLRVVEPLRPFLPAKPAVDPLVAMLCGELDISPAAAKKALANLEAKGLIERAGDTISFEGEG